MTGPEHYREAERLLAAIRELPTLEPSDARESAAVILAGVASLAAQAQAHATLALTAATAESIVNAPATYGSGEIQRAWSEAIS